MPSPDTMITLEALKDLLGPPSALHSENPHIGQGTPLSHLYIDYGPAGTALPGFPRFSNKEPHAIRRYYRRKKAREVAREAKIAQAATTAAVQEERTELLFEPIPTISTLESSNNSIPEDSMALHDPWHGEIF